MSRGLRRARATSLSRSGRPHEYEYERPKRGCQRLDAQIVIVLRKTRPLESVEIEAISIPRRSQLYEKREPLFIDPPGQPASSEPMPPGERLDLLVSTESIGVPRHRVGLQHEAEQRMVMCLDPSAKRGVEGRPEALMQIYRSG